tara:strand:- start:493 stop:1365 length:873 start_codon:yes stop_codon:yes gene_type:complete
MKEIKGSGVALVTCFNNDLSIDYDSMDKLLSHVITGGVDYLVLLGTTGESVTLSKKEKNEIVTFVRRKYKEIPIVIGIGGNSTSNILQEIKETDFEGIDAILSVSPYYNKPTQEGIYNHYKMISKLSPKPLILYNVPSRTGSNISSQTTLRLAHDFENIVAIKEASGNLDQIMSILKDKPDNFTVLSGDDSLTLPMIYMGAKGVISVIGQLFPQEYTNMVHEALNNNIYKANSIHYKLYQLYGPLYVEGNPVGIKAALNTLDICNLVVRPPLINASKEIVDQFESLLHNK